MKAIRAIIPAAGKGSRLQAVCGDLPKAMFLVGNRPMLKFVLDNVSFVEPKDTYIVVGYRKENIINKIPEISLGKLILNLDVAKTFLMKQTKNS